MAMTLKKTIAQLEATGNEKVRAQHKKNGADDNQFGIRLGDIRKLAAKIVKKESFPREGGGPSFAASRDD